MSAAWLPPAGRKTALPVVKRRKTLCFQDPTPPKRGDQPRTDPAGVGIDTTNQCVVGASGVPKLVDQRHTREKAGCEKWMSEIFTVFVKARFRIFVNDHRDCE